MESRGTTSIKVGPLFSEGEMVWYRGASSGLRRRGLLSSGPGNTSGGTAWEIGFAYARDIPVIGIRTNFRNAGDTGHSSVNAMIEGSVAGIVQTSAEAVSQLEALAGTWRG